ncbi:hypothetical protein [Streptomyces phage Psst1]|nr:hypothetical protein [Streptomyces phage Psst1]WPJ30677.1 hypothetical protein [Streptomyces phage Psst2]
MIKTPMVDLQKEAKEALKYHGLEADGKGGIKVRLVLDHSGSMFPWYKAGAVQRLTEQVLGLASALDDDGTIETWYFGSDVSKPYAVSLNQTDPEVQKVTGWRPSGWRRRPKMAELDPYYVGWVDRSHVRQSWGSTNYAAAIKAPVEFQREAGEEEPALVIFQTDGGPDSQEAARRTLQHYSGDKTFFVFAVFGELEENASPGSVTHFMENLDNLNGRIRDNASYFFTGKLEEYATSTDTEFYDMVLGEFVGGWLPQVL